jgi:adenine deaminase
VIEASESTVAAVHALGSDVESPFQSLAFLALSVIPSLKITDHGLVDVDRFQLVPLAVDVAVSAP